MANSVQVYKSGVLLGAGTVEEDATSITSFTAEASRVTGSGRNVQCVISTTDGLHLGRGFNTRVTVDGGTSLTISDPCPYSDT